MGNVTRILSSHQKAAAYMDLLSKTVFTLTYCVASLELRITMRHCQNKGQTLQRRHGQTAENNQKVMPVLRLSSKSVSSRVRCPWKIKAVLISISLTHPTQFITLIQLRDKSPTINDVPSVTMPSSPRFLDLIKHRRHLPHQLAHM